MTQTMTLPDHLPCTSNDKEYCQIDTYSEHSNCGISCGITKAALDYELQIRKLLILLYTSLCMVL